MTTISLGFCTQSVGRHLCEILFHHTLCEAVQRDVGPLNGPLWNKSIYCYPLSKKRCGPPPRCDPLGPPGWRGSWPQAGGNLMIESLQLWSDFNGACCTAALRGLLSWYPVCGQVSATLLNLPMNCSDLMIKHQDSSLYYGHPFSRQIDPLASSGWES